jgi:hypothetical protein
VCGVCVGRGEISVWCVCVGRGEISLWCVCVCRKR